MPSADEIQAGLTGAWQLMLGKADGLRQFNLSADGFWNSFFAMVVALPALFAMWTAQAIDLAPAAGAFSERAGLVMQLAIIDFAGWVGPLLIAAWALSRFGMGGRMALFVIANNWASAWFTWVMLPVVLLSSFFPSLGDVATALLMLVFLVSLFLLWRLNNVILRNAGVTTTVVAGMIVLSLFIYAALDWLFALPQQPVM
jgi:hypothetical protein